MEPLVKGCNDRVEGRLRDGGERKGRTGKGQRSGRIPAGRASARAGALGMATWDTKIVITRVPEHPQGSEFCQNHPTISLKVLPCPKVLKGFGKA